MDLYRGVLPDWEGFKDFTRVENAVWVERLFDAEHGGDFGGAVLETEEGGFSQSDAVLSCYGAAEAHYFFHQ